MSIIKHWYQNILISLFLIITIGISCTGMHIAHASPVAYDISGWQGDLTYNKAIQLKHEVRFMILKAEQGDYQDPVFANNANCLRRANVPYGVYDYSVYQNSAQARQEATQLYRYAPHAKFYVNDCEVNSAGSDLDDATQAWANQMHRLTHKPVVLYSDLAFMSGLASSTRSSYDASWVAAYGMEPNPAWHYDLWQYTDQQYSPALGQNVDASAVPDGGRSLSFWTGDASKKSYYQHHKTIKRYAKPRKRYRRRVIRHKHYRRKIQRIHKYVSPEYYQSHNVKHLIVVKHGGISLYNIHGKYLRHIQRGMILHVRYFRKFPYTRHAYMTRAVDYHHHEWVMYTAKKNKLHPYYFKKY